MGRQFKKLIEEVGDFSMQQREQTIRERMSLNLKEFADKVSAFNRLGEQLYGGGNFSKLAEELEEIANGAEAYTLRETEDSPFDQVTIKRNMKELKGYTSQFKEVAAEARALQERMTALYEDSGRVLGRYFEIKEMGQPDGMGDQNDLAVKSEPEKIVNARAGVRESHTNCPGCGKPMTECTCEGMNEAACPDCNGKGCAECNWVGTDKQDSRGNPKLQEADKKWIQKAVDPEHKGYCTPMTKSTCTPARKALAQRFKKGIDKEGVNESMKLRHLMKEDITDDRPKDDWVVLDVPKLRYDVALDFEKDLKKQGFEVKRFDWKERTGAAEEFSEFFVHKDDYDEANAYAVKAYQSFDNNSRMEKE